MTACFCWAFPVIAQPANDFKAQVNKVLEMDFKAITVHLQDTVIVDKYLAFISRCIETRNDSATYYSEKAITLANKAGLPNRISVILQKLGQYYMMKENFSEAINCFILAMKIEEKREDEKRIADLLAELGNVYNYQEIFNKALEFNTEAFKIYKKRKDTIQIASILSHIGSLHLTHEYCEKRSSDQLKQDLDMALDFYDQSMKLYEMKGDLDGIASVNNSIGAVYNRMNRPEIALGYVGKALGYYQSIRNQEKISSMLYSMALIYNRLHKFDQAQKCLGESKEIAMRENIKEGIQYLYQAIAQTYVNQKSYKNALDYYLEYMIIRDSVYNNEKSKQVFELETRYQVEKKQGEIVRLTMVKQQRTVVIYILTGTLLLGFLVGWMYFRNIRNKRIIADQKLEIKENQLLELKKERQLSAAKSVLQGEEAERSRLAGDLHDGLGGLLTGVKLKLSSMKENAIITSENLANFNHAINLLDTSITELRRVAHNMMPETLMHFGLRTALMDFVQQIAPEELPVLRFNTFGDDLRFSKELEVTVYRITQELITNAIKHAQAKQIDIQLFAEHDRICVQVVDNGSGFDSEQLDSARKGHGLKNIQDRATAFNGRFEIISQQGKGTESTIEFLIS